MEPYSQTYQEVRLLFRKAAERAGAAIREYPVAKGRTDHELVIDVASLGHPEPVWSLVVSSGLHGIEGFFGSAIQTAYLRTISGPELTDSRGQLVFIHALNPFGFAMLRRFNEDNVDLNRNFLLSGEKYLGSSKQYAQLDHFLNPPYPPRSGDFYLAKALWNIIRFRYRALKQAVAEGQFEYPKGLFFGGDKPSESTKIFQNEIIKRIRGRCIVHLDFHSGLGKSASYKLLVPKQRRHDLPRYSAIFGPGNVEVIGGRKGVAYDVRAISEATLLRSKELTIISCLPNSGLIQGFGSWVRFALKIKPISSRRKAA
jgi:Protein of unknown function (DUF2817)